MDKEKLKKLIYEQIPYNNQEACEAYEKKRRKDRYIKENRIMILEAVLSSVLCINYHMVASFLTDIPVLGMILGLLMVLFALAYRHDEFRDEEMVYDGILEVYEVRRDTMCWYLISIINMSSLLSIVAMRGKLLLFYGQPGIDLMTSETLGAAAMVIALIPAFVRFDFQRMILHILFVIPMFIISAIVVESSGDPFRIGLDMWIVYRFLTLCLAAIALSIIIRRKSKEKQYVTGGR